MKHLLFTTIAAVVLVGCGESQSPQPKSLSTSPAALIHQATRGGNIESVKQHLAPDISIHEAAEKGNIEAVKQHLAAGTDVNALDDDGGTPLALAIRSGNTETADLLRKHGVPEPEYVP